MHHALAAAPSAVVTEVPAPRRTAVRGSERDGLAVRDLVREGGRRHAGTADAQHVRQRAKSVHGRAQRDRRHVEAAFVLVVRVEEIREVDAVERRGARARGIHLVVGTQRHVARARDLHGRAQDAHLLRGKVHLPQSPEAIGEAVVCTREIGVVDDIAVRAEFHILVRADVAGIDRECRYT